MKFREAIHRATVETMRRDPRVFVAGLGVPDLRGVFGTTLGLVEEFGRRRVFDIPISENAVAGACIGAAFRGLRPIFVHQRVDFLLLAMDQLVNHAAKWRAMFGGRQRVPIVLRAIVGRGWGNGPQHTQSLHATFAHIPGLKVVVPATPADAGGLLIAAVEDDDPVVYIEHRWLHEEDGDVDGGSWRVPIGRARVARRGDDVTIVAVGPLVGEALTAAAALGEMGISAEVVDLRTVRPIDRTTVLASVGRTGRLVVADPDWGPCGVAGEIVATVAEHAFDALRTAPARVTWPDSPVPSSEALERHFYPGAAEVQAAALRVCERRRPAELVTSAARAFEGPF